MTYPILHIEWDSKFFGFPIGTVDIPPDYSAALLRESLHNARERYRLIYINLGADGPDSLPVQGASCVCYDRKIILKKSVPENLPQPDPHVRSYTSAFCLPVLERLAIQSGTMTRFKNDPELSAQYERLYLTWINFAVTKELADSIWTWVEDGQHLGLVTMRCAKRTRPDTGQIEREGRIGMFSVDSKYRRRGIGTYLLVACDFWCHSLGVPVSSIVTQRDNKPMISLCQKFGFEAKHEESVYHYWSPNWIFDVHRGWFCRKGESRET